MGEMGKETLQDGIDYVVEDEVHKSTRLIRPLEIGTSVGVAGP